MENNQLVQLGRQIQQGKKRTHTVQIDLRHIDPEYIGTFVFHYPSLMEQMNIGVIKSRLLGGIPTNSVDVLTDNIAHMTATLQVVMDSAPNWFKLEELDDYEVLYHVYEEYTKWRDSFLRRDSKSNN